MDSTNAESPPSGIPGSAEAGIPEKLANEINAINRPYQSGDVTLIASDGLKFRVKSYQLQAMSGVFADMLETHAKGDPIELSLTDELMETGTCVRLLLDTCHGIIRADTDSRIKPTLALARLCVKYECAIPTILLKAKLETWLRKTPDPAEWIFTVASVLDDVELCAMAISRYRYTVRLPLSPKAKRVSLSSTKPGYCSFDLRNASTADFGCIPLRFARALMRAQSEWDLETAKWGDIAGEFQALMETPEQPAAEAEHLKFEMNFE